MKKIFHKWTAGLAFFVCLCFWEGGGTPVRGEDAKISTVQDSPKETPAHGDRIIFGSIAEASNLIPYLSSDSSSHEVSDLLFVAPLRYNKNLEIEPYAAESYQVLDQGRLLRFTLRPGILWEDGVELTAADVEFTWKLVTNPETASPYAEDFMTVKSFTTTGRYTFEVRYEKYFARALISWMSAILPRHILEGQNIHSTSFSRKPVGAGPYRMLAWEAGTRIRLKASPTYFAGQPYIDEVVYRIIPDPSTMFLEAKAGKLDFMGLSPQQYLRQTQGEPWDSLFKKYKYLSSSYVYLGFNLQHPLFQDVRVRQAVSCAINRDDIIKGVLLGEGTPAFGPYKPGSWAYSTKITPVRQDVEKSKKMLREAGFSDSNGDGILEKNGKAFAFTILTNQGNEQRILAATVIQAQLKAVGIDVRIRTVEWAAFIKEFIHTGRFDAVILGWTITQDPDIFDVWHSSKAKPGGLNFTRYSNAEVDALLVEARSIPDRARRKVLYDRVQEIMHADQPYCFLFVPYALPIVQARFQGIKPALAGIMYNFEKWWVPASRQMYQP